MDSNIQALFRELAPSPRVERIIEADRLLMNLRHTDHQDGFEIFTSNDDHMETQALITTAEQLILDQCAEILGEHGIVLKPNPMSVYVDLVECIYGLGDLDDLDIFRIALDESDTPEDLFEALVGVMLDEEPMIVGDWVEDVSSIFVHLIERHYELRAEAPETASEATEAPQRLRSYVDSGKAPSFYRAARMGLRMHQSVRYYQMALEEELMMAEDLSNERHAEECLAWVLASDTTDADLKTATLRLLEPHFEDHTSALLRLGDLIQEWIAGNNTSEVKV